MSKSKIITYALAVIITVGVGATLSIAANWTAPAGLPPGNNVEAPINVGSTPQTKNGPLTLQGKLTVGEICLGGVCKTAWPEGGITTTTTPSSTYAPGRQSYTIPGSYTFNVPENVSILEVEMWGGGGGGAAGRRATVSLSGPYVWLTLGGSGGSGGYARQTINVTPGQSITLEVGGGGEGLGTANQDNAANIMYSGKPGGASFLVKPDSSIIYAFGGEGGRDIDSYRWGHGNCGGVYIAQGGSTSGGGGLSRNGNRGNYCLANDENGWTNTSWRPTVQENSGGTAVVSAKTGDAFGKGGSGRNRYAELPSFGYTCDSEGNCSPTTLENPGISGPAGDNGGDGAVIIYW